jgi:ABC-type multidrug transport system ATPase subunit
MFLLWLLNIAVTSDNTEISAFVNTPNPEITSYNSIPSCMTDSFVRNDPCWDFIYSPNTSVIAQSIANGMRLNNPGRVIDPSAILGFTSIAEANTFLAANPERVLGGVHFLLDANTGPNATATEVPAAGGAPLDLNYVLQVNSTIKYFKAKFQDPTFFSAVPIQVAAEREIARYQLQTAAGGSGGGTNLSTASQLQWDVSMSSFAHPETGDVNIVGQAMGPFVFAANMFNFVLLLSSVVAERERGLRQALKTTGMMDSSFWLSWAVVELAISVLFTLFTIAFGAMFQFRYFLHNSFAVVFLLFLLFQWAMVGVAFLLSTLISKTSTAINLGFVIFIFGWVLQTAIAFDFPYSPENISSVPIITVIFTLLPFAPLSKGAVDLGAASEATENGITWSRRSEYCQNIKNPSEQDSLYATNPNAYWDFDCVFPLGTILAILAIEALVYFLLAIYLNNVLRDENGVRKKPWYLFTPEYWRGGSRSTSNRRGSRGGDGGSSIITALKPSIPCPVLDGAIGEGQGDADVLAEENEMKALMQHRLGNTGRDSKQPLASASADATHAVEVFGLQKAFGSGWCSGISKKCCCCLSSMSCCCGRRNSSSTTSGQRSTGKKSKEFWAIKGSWFSIEKDRVFCLLGPNGAGKTTTINCLTGVLPATGGDALVYGESVTNPGSIERIRSVMGVCPQFDVQWGELTGAEHLYIYGRVKGLSAKHVAAQSENLLESVKLTSAAGQRTSSYSGGMRRRLSVAVALLGDPLIVYLDEPTTGMDPISRRHVWDAIEAAKPGRAVVLTTHSMEEADILGDTIAIMARGRVRAYGSSLRLKQRFGSGYQLAVAVSGGTAGGKDGGVANGNTNGNKKENAEVKKARVDAVTALFKRELGVSAPEAGTGAYLVFLVPKSAENELPGFLRQLEERKNELGVTDIQISLTSLEEVFLSIARQAEVEAAAAEGRSVVEVRIEDGSILEVDVGAEHAQQETTGRKYAVKWAQDEEGRLSVSSWTLLDDNHTNTSPENGNSTVVAAPVPTTMMASQ